MDGNLVVCIAREFGSGGREVGRLVADKMGMAFYDKELMREAAKKSGIVEELFEKADEKPTNSLLYSLSMAATGSQAPPVLGELSPYTSNDRLQNYVADVIREVAERSPCVIIGRCADYILRDRDKTASLFLHAKLEKRIARIAKLHNVDEDTARTMIRKTDKTRANYYSYFTDREWGDACNYDMAVDAGRFGIEATADALCLMLERLYGTVK